MADMDQLHQHEIFINDAFIPYPHPVKLSLSMEGKDGWRLGILH